MTSSATKTSLVYHHRLNDKLWLGTKSDLTGCLESCLYVDVRQDAPDIDVVIFDGSVVVNVLKPVAVNTFDDYALFKGLLPYSRSQLDRANRIDVGLDQYKPNSPKSQTRYKRDKGVWRRVDENWQQFLRIDANRQSCSPSKLNTSPPLMQQRKLNITA